MMYQEARTELMTRGPLGSNPLPHELFDVALNLSMGAHYLWTKLNDVKQDEYSSGAEFAETVRRALVRYNGGSGYGAEVMAKAERFMPSLLVPVFVGP
jgi:soluble lytic murein transglycosylase-like protein